MRTSLIIAFLITTSLAFGQEKAKKYDMKQYYFVLLTKGPNRNQDSATASKIQAGHLSNMEKMAEMGKLQVAGPFTDGGAWQGIFIFDAVNKEEVELLLKTDPAISSGRLN